MTEILILLVVAAIVLIPLALAGVLTLGLGAWIARRRAAAPAPPPAPPRAKTAEQALPRPKTAEQALPRARTAEQTLPKAPISKAPAATPVPAPMHRPTHSGAPPPMMSAAGFIGLPESNDSAKTELFQRGANVFVEHEEDTDDVADEVSGATEIFSAHGPAGDPNDPRSRRPSVPPER